MPANLENSAVATGLQKVSFHLVPKKDSAKECSNYHTIAFISHTSKVMLKIFKASLQQYMNHELPMSKLDLEKAEEPEIKLPTSVRSLKKQKDSRKTSISALLTMPKPLTVWITINCGKFLEMGIPGHLTCFLRNQVCRSGSNSWNWIRINGLVPNQERTMSRLYIVTLLI